MFNYQKTELGFQTLKDRQLHIKCNTTSVSLLLIGSDDFNQMPVHYQQRIAEETLLEQLMELGLIQPITAHDHLRLQSSDFSAFNTPKKAPSNRPISNVSPASDRTAQENVTFNELSMPTMEVPQYSVHSTKLTDSPPMDAMGFIPHQFNQATPENYDNEQPCISQKKSLISSSMILM